MMNKLFNNIHCAYDFYEIIKNLQPGDKILLEKNTNDLKPKVVSNINLMNFNNIIGSKTFSGESNIPPKDIHDILIQPMYEKYVYPYESSYKLQKNRHSEKNVKTMIQNHINEKYTSSRQINHLTQIFHYMVSREGLFKTPVNDYLRWLDAGIKIYENANPENILKEQNINDWCPFAF